MISALQFYDWENPFELGKKTFNLALGMGPYFGPMRALEKGLILIIETDDMIFIYSGKPF